jgi:hypothetical protein
MSFRAGNQGHEMWPECLRLGVAAITYDPLAATDLSKHPPGQPLALWEQLSVSQKVSLRRVAYEMRPGDVIYVKQGPKIIDKGTVVSGYEYDSRSRIVDPFGTTWSHQVRVSWSAEFPEVEMLLGTEQYTVRELSIEDVERIEKAVKRCVPSAEEGAIFDGLIEEAYYRASPASLKYILPRHKQLSNEFCRWLRVAHGIEAVQEKRQIDVRFELNGQTALAELKVCFGVGSTKSIREALGQTLEYNHYPSRRSADHWLLIMDIEPSALDKQFIQILRNDRRLPIVLGWRVRQNFCFFPCWPSKSD